MLPSHAIRMIINTRHCKTHTRHMFSTGKHTLFNYGRGEKHSSGTVKLYLFYLGVGID